MLFSVIIPTFNRAHVLPRTLGSVFAQRSTDYEIIVVDDGSTDDTREYLRSVGERVVCLSQVNHGPGEARNLGARHAKGDYFAFLDSDDLWFPWTLSCFAELIGRYGGPAILSARLVEFSAESDLKDARETEVKAQAFRDYYASHCYHYFVGSGMSVLRRDAFLGSRGYVNLISSFEDHDLIMRLGEASGFIQVIEPVTLGYRKHSENLSGSSRRSFEGACYLIEQEQAGRYPGGRARARERRAIITQRTRPATFSLAKRGLIREAWAIYFATFAWNVALGRWRYLCGFPMDGLLARTPTTSE